MIAIVSPRQQALAVVAEVAARHGITIKRVLGRSRKRPILAARHDAIISIAKAFQNWSRTHIGRFFGMHWASVIHVFRKFSYVHPGAHAPRFKPVAQLRQDFRDGASDQHHQKLPSMPEVKHGGIQCSLNRVQEMPI